MLNSVYIIFIMLFWETGCYNEDPSFPRPQTTESDND